MKKIEEISGKKVKALFTKQKRLFGYYYKKANIVDNAVMIIRENRSIDFKEGVKGNKFTFTHSNGETRVIELNPLKRMRMSFLDKDCSVFIVDENSPFPVPSNILMDMEQFVIAQEKTLNDVKEWKAKETKANAELLKQAGVVIGIIIGGFILYKLLIDDPAKVVQTVQTAKPVVEQIARNVTVVG